MRILTTALPAPVRWPSRRPGGFDHGLLPAFYPAAGTEALLARLEHPEALLVSTGQQPALFTGPLYAIHKALSAAALARALEARWEVPVQAVFWVAGDDHDFAEANHAGWLGRDGTLHRSELPARPPDAPLTPMYREILGDGIEARLEEFEQGLPPSEYLEPVFAWLRRHYRAGATVAGSFGHALAEILAPHGVLCLDSTHLAVKQAAAPHLLRALDDAAGLEEDLLGRHATLTGAGNDPGVTVGDGATLVMLEASQGRDRLVRQDGGFVTRRSGERFSLEALRAVADGEPTRLSGNVLLRPVIETLLLPTVAYAAGPGELRYLPLCAPVYRHFGAVTQLPVPRWSGMLVEPRVDRVLAKFGATLEELLEPGGGLEARVVRSQVPEEVLRILAGLRAAVHQAYDGLEPLVKEIDPTMQKPAETARHRMMHQAEELEKRLVAHQKKRQETEMTQISRARAAVRPDGKPQERVLCAPPLLARYGFDLLGLIAEHIDGWYRTALVDDGAAVSWNS
ncbi:MAG: bacillithiol biosynthesis cysteine-adding enzyme BshC [Gemmatimonadales bacterium]